MSNLILLLKSLKLTSMRVWWCNIMSIASVVFIKNHLNGTWIWYKTVLNCLVWHTQTCLLQHWLSAVDRIFRPALCFLEWSATFARGILSLGVKTFCFLFVQVHVLINCCHSNKTPQVNDPFLQPCLYKVIHLYCVIVAMI